MHANISNSFATFRTLSEVSVALYIPSNHETQKESVKIDYRSRKKIITIEAEIILTVEHEELSGSMMMVMSLESHRRNRFGLQALPRKQRQEDRSNDLKMAYSVCFLD